MNKLIVEPAPHIRSDNSTSQIMRNVIIATIPSIIASVIIFGPRAILLITVCVCSCVFFEFLFRHIFKKPLTITDLSAVVTGILLSFNLPVTLPIYMAVLASFVAIVVVKELFGGLGQNFANPAIVGRIFLMLSFPSHMSNYVEPFSKSVADAVTTATPLAVENAAEMPSMTELFFGLHGGSLGETCSFTLLMGLVYLLVMRIIRPITSLTFIGTVLVGVYIITGNPIDSITAILTGGVLLGAIFMATDYTTNPMTPIGKAIFGFGCGFITLVIRQYGSMPEGTAFAILTMNILTPLIDRLTPSKPLGANKGGKKS